MKRRILSILLIIFTLLGCGVILSFHIITKSSTSIAHKGHNIFAPNTLSAFKMAKSFDAIECDVWITKDNQFIINHDATIKSTKNKDLVISDSTLNDLQNSCGKITMLDEFLSICKKNNNYCVIDIKSYCLSRSQALTFIDKLKSLNLEAKTLILSYEQTVILTFKDITSAMLFYVFNNNIEENSTFCLKNNINACINYKLINPNLVETFHSQNLKINAWTVDEIFTYMWLSSIGVDYITSDFFN